MYSELPKSGTLNGKYNFNKLQKVLELHTFLLALCVKIDVSES